MKVRIGMWSFSRGVTVCAVAFCARAGAEVGEPLQLWYEQPAREWVESLPVGNGRLLATNRGGVRHEVIQLNEDTIWSGRPEDKDRPGADKAFAEARRLALAGEYKQADLLINEKVLTPHVAHGRHTYQTLGNLHLYFNYGDAWSEPVDYRRELDLDTAISAVRFSINGVRHERELYSSAVDQVIVARFASDRSEALNFDAVFERPGANVTFEDGRRLVVRGQATDSGDPQSGGVHYEAQIEFRLQGGRLREIPGGVRVEGASGAELRIVAATDYHGGKPYEICEHRLAAISRKTYDALRADHVADHRRLFRRVELQLGGFPNVRGLRAARVETMPTDMGIAAFRQGTQVPGLIERFFQLGRYILITASRPGTQAINLWGKWVESVEPAYNADYHTNINIQMNYWPAQVGNLAECQTPFFDLIDELRPNGRITAQKVYHCRGFVAHHATDAWRFTAAVGRAPHGMWMLTPAWGAHQMWQHFLYTGDRDYLAAKSYPVMKEAALFFIDHLVEDPQTGYLVSGPSTSPENTFIAPDGSSASVSMAPAMDVQLIRDLFANCIAASRVLGVDEDLRETLQAMLGRLPPLLVDANGRLMEWLHPFEENQPGHKHCAHLWAVCEGDLITPAETPELAAAARRSLDRRVAHGSAETPVYRGNTAWILRSYVRLGDGDAAYRILRYLLGDSTYPNMFAVSPQGLRRKMWETDANLGATAAIAEMVVQSHAGAIDLLPALPAVWPEGRVSGLRAEGGFEVEVAWKAGRLSGATVKSLRGGASRVRYKGRVVEFKAQPGEILRFDGNLDFVRK